MDKVSQSEQLNPVASYPKPGPAPVRPIWDGEKAAPPIVVAPPEDPNETRWNRELAFGPVRNSNRITGLDAARGVALFGMIAVHILPAYNEYTGRPTLIWQASAGHAAPLFAVLTGVAIALLTGANNPHTGRRLLRSRVTLAVRAIFILLLGLSINELRLPVYNILPYYGLMFLFAIPLVSLRIRTLLSLALGWALLGPAAAFFINSHIDYTTTYNPNFTSLFQLTSDTLITLFEGGTYPLITWMTYILVGIAIGRLNLRWMSTQVSLIVCGAGLTLTAIFASTFLVDFLGGFAKLFHYTKDYKVEDITNVLDYGPDGHMPTDTWWWLTVNGPHTNTPCNLLTCTGLSLMVIGSMLVISRMLNHLLDPLIAAGSMTLTLYTIHLVLFSFFDVSIHDAPVIWFLAQAFGALILASTWLSMAKKGPIESVVSRLCRFISRVIVPNPPQPVIVDQK